MIPRLHILHKSIDSFVKKPSNDGVWVDSSQLILEYLDEKEEAYEILSMRPNPVSGFLDIFIPSKHTYKPTLKYLLDMVQKIEIKKKTISKPRLYIRNEKKIMEFDPDDLAGCPNAQELLRQNGLITGQLKFVLESTNIGGCIYLPQFYERSPSSAVTILEIERRTDLTDSLTDLVMEISPVNLKGIKKEDLRISLSDIQSGESLKEVYGRGNRLNLSF